MDISTIIGSTGVTVLLIAFVLQQLKMISSSHFLYGLLNTLGAGLAAYSSYLIDFLPFVILECTWALVSLSILLRSLSKGLTIHPQYSEVSS